MPKLVIGNTGSDNMVGHTRRKSIDKRQKSAAVAQRLLWLLHQGDAILLPEAPSPVFARYAFDVMGLDPDRVTVVVPPHAEVEPQILNLDVLNHPDLLARLSAVLHRPETWTVEPYYFDRPIAWLAERLQLCVAPPQLGCFRQGAAEQLNSKVQFRRLAAAHDVPVAEGAICFTPDDVALALTDLLPITGAVMVKQDLNASGDGNLIVAAKPPATTFGAGEVLDVGTLNARNLAGRIWSQLTGFRNEAMVVEAYYAATGVYYTELDIPVSRRPRLLNFGEMRMEPVWIGFEIPSPSLNPYEVGELTSVSSMLASLAATTGYTGKINCDAIRTMDGKILFTEINGRLGGCTHVHEVARALLGPEYAAKYVLLTRNKVKTGSFDAVVSNCVAKICIGVGTPVKAPSSWRRTPGGPGRSSTW